MKNELLYSNLKKDDEYGTPEKIFRDGCKIFNFDPKVDYAASKENHKCSRYYTQYDNSLNENWTKDGFLNFPYSKAKEFLKKAWQEHTKNNISILILMFAHTDTKYWHEYIENRAEVSFIQGRIKFIKNGKTSKHSAPFPSAWIFYRKQLKPGHKCGQCRKWFNYYEYLEHTDYANLL